MNKSVFVPLIALLLGGLLFWSGCSKDSPTKSKTVSEEDRLGAQLKVSEAEGLWSTAAVQAPTSRPWLPASSLWGSTPWTSWTTGSGG